MTYGDSLSTNSGELHSHLKATWDELYGKRSEMVHGLLPNRDQTFDELANKVISLCGQISLGFIAVEVEGADSNADLRYNI